MDEMNGLGEAAQAASECVGFIDRFFATLDKWNFLPMCKYRRQNMFDKQAVQLELDEKEKTHKQKIAIEDARVRALTSLMEQSATLALKAAERDIENGMDAHEALAKNDTSAIYATSYLYKEALNGQYARERVSLYAALDAASEPVSESMSTEDPSDTWMHHFMKFVSDLRDEDAYKLWGKVLAGEVKTPGAFSLRFLNILANLDQRDAWTFKKLALYMLLTFMPTSICKQLDVNVYTVKTLESLGLLITDVEKPFDGNINVCNNYYVAFSTAIMNKPCSIPAIMLTPAGVELLKLIGVSKEDALKGINAFTELAKVEYGQELNIMERPQEK